MLEIDRGPEVSQMLGRTGNPIHNQYIISCARCDFVHDWYEGDAFQSYGRLIALKAYQCGNTGNCAKILIDKDYYNCSRTTSKYLNRFLGGGMGAKDIKALCEEEGSQFEFAILN